MIDLCAKNKGLVQERGGLFIKTAQTFHGEKGLNPNNHTLITKKIFDQMLRFLLCNQLFVIIYLTQDRKVPPNLGLEKVPQLGYSLIGI
jgi:hypothetical protein